jgi:putative DNA primase/helicase
LAQSRSVIRFWRGQWWEWCDGRYVQLDEPELRARITGAIKSDFGRMSAAQALTANADPYQAGSRKYSLKVTKGLVGNVLQALGDVVLVPGALDQPVWFPSSSAALGHTDFIALTNGLLDVSRREPVLRSSTPDWFSPVRLPFAYDPKAKCPRWDRFLSHIQENDPERIALIQEWFGYCLAPDMSYHKFLVCEGEGANGKTVMVDILGYLVGIENVSHVPLEMFGLRFQLASTLGKLVNIASDVGHIDHGAEGLLKAFTSGDRMTFDRKNLAPVSAYPTARLVFATNDAPRFADQSEGIWRRLIYLPFHVEIPANKQDRSLTQKLRAELPGIFNWALAGRRRLYEQQHFTEPEICTEALAEYRMASDPSRTFLSERCEVKPGTTVKVGDVYSKYSDWAKENGFPAANSAAFGIAVRRAFPTIRRVRQTAQGARFWVYEGLALRKVAMTRAVFGSKGQS